jgi:dTDP-4-dehydrorhamnose 3,5-epimerase
MISLISGKGLDFVVDLRKNSKTFKKWFKTELNAESSQIIYIPHGFGHGFLSLSPDTIMSFKIDQYFDNDLSKSISYKDPEINLNIQLNENLLSEQDKNAPFLVNSDCNL